MAISAIRDFLKLEAAGGIVLIFVSAFALIVAHSQVSGLYVAFLDMPVAVQVGALSIAKPAILWINDGLMAVFFFLIGLEIKRELMVGELSSLRKAAFPITAAVGGMIVQVLFYISVNLLLQLHNYYPE